MVRALAAQEPIWPPGTRHGYHMRTFGWLVGELVRRVDGRTIGAFWREEIAAPLGLDFWIGLPEEIEPRVARLVPPKDDLGALLPQGRPPTSCSHACSRIRPVCSATTTCGTRRALHAAELPSSNGIGDARGRWPACTRRASARSTACARSQPSTVAAATVEQACGKDEVLMTESCFGLGFMLGKSFGAANRPTAFGHAGAGGSLVVRRSRTPVSGSAT